MSGMAMPGASSNDADHWSATAGAAFHSDGVTRTYYISADRVVWNYAPIGRNEITGRPFDRVADTYVKSGRGRIGSRYVKCLYRGYTDTTFRHVQRRPADERYLGLLGPVIRAEVDDTIKVVFRNACPFADSVHPHGVFYEKDSEGAPYNDATHGKDKADDAVRPGRRHTYVWQVPERAGPGPGDGSSVMWMYHSHTDEQQRELGRSVPAGAKLSVLSSCSRRASTPSGPGDWVCTLDVFIPQPGAVPFQQTPVSYDVSVRSDGCYKAESPPSFVGQQTLSVGHGHSVVNPLFVFDDATVELCAPCLANAVELWKPRAVPDGDDIQVGRHSWRHDGDDAPQLQRQFDVRGRQVRCDISSGSRTRLAA